MAEIVRMPKLSDTMVEGVIAEWHKNIGDTVESGDLLAEIETDKATMEFEAFEEGVLLYIGVEKGGAAPVDSVLAILGDKGEDITSILEGLKDEKTLNTEGGEITEKIDAPPKSNKIIPKSEKEKETTAPIIHKTKATTYPPLSSIADDRVKISPLARKIANERNINLKLLKGTGEGGRIIKRDIDNYNSSLSSYTGVENFIDENISQMRKVIATRLGESKFSAPHFYLTVSIDMDNAIEARKSINSMILPEKISFNDLVIKATAMSLKEHPEVNSSWYGDFIRTNEHIHIGVAVAVPEGLLVPVVRFADGKTLTQIGAEVKEYAKKAKEKKLQPEDWQGNTFTISNLGMFGIEEFTAIINSPDAAILAVGGISKVPVVKNGEIVPGNIMKVTLSCDHRVIDGAVGSSFLNTFKNYMENPVLMLGKHNI